MPGWLVAPSVMCAISKSWRRTSTYRRRHYRSMPRWPVFSDAAYAIAGGPPEEFEARGDHFGKPHSARSASKVPWSCLTAASSFGMPNVSAFTRDSEKVRQRNARPHRRRLRARHRLLANSAPGNMCEWLTQSTWQSCRTVWRDLQAHSVHARSRPWHGPQCRHFIGEVGLQQRLSVPNRHRSTGYISDHHGPALGLFSKKLTQAGQLCAGRRVSPKTKKGGRSCLLPTMTKFFRSATSALRMVCGGSGLIAAL